MGIGKADERWPVAGKDQSPMFVYWLSLVSGTMPAWREDLAERQEQSQEKHGTFESPPTHCCSGAVEAPQRDIQSSSNSALQRLEHVPGLFAGEIRHLSSLGRASVAYPRLPPSLAAYKTLCIAGHSIFRSPSHLRLTPSPFHPLASSPRSQLYVTPLFHFSSSYTGATPHNAASQISLNTSTTRLHPAPLKLHLHNEGHWIPCRCAQRGCRR